MRKLSQKLSDSSGVYLFIGKNKEVLYVGRAVNLKRRTAQYFQKGLDSRIAEMVRLAKRVEIRTTPTLWEAIILEANLIKKYQPKYNIRDKDNKSFVYLIIPKRAAYAQPVIIRGRELSINRLLITNHYIFGPFQGVRELNELLKIIRRAIPFSFGKCRPLGGQPCFDYQIGLCPGACLGAITSQDYQKNIRNLVLLFSGKKQAVLKNLKKQNPDKAKMLQRLQDVSLLTNNQLPITNHQFERIEAYDISHFGGKNTYGAMSVAINGELTKDQYRLFKTRNAPQNDDLRALQETLERRLNHKEWAYPDLILVDGGIPQVRHIYGLLRSLKVGTPLVGISKINGDKLVFPPGLSKLKHGQIKGIRGLLLLLRNEAHRFGNRARKHSGGV